MRRSSLVRAHAEKLADLTAEQTEALLATMTPADLRAWLVDFAAWAHEGQLEPEGDWRNWLMQAGRGYGKTRAGAEWVADKALAAPARIALVGATIEEARAVMVEGDSGLIAVLRQRRRRFCWEPALKRLTLPNGTVIRLYSGENPDGLRGGNHHFAWCDELAKWAKPEEAWDNLQMALRSGLAPRALVTTTPRPGPALTRILGDPGTVVTGGRMEDNLTLEDAFRTAMRAAYDGTRIGRQELDGVLLEDVEGALWTRGLLDCARSERQPEFVRVVVGVDPPASDHGDACGIVVAGLGRDGIGYVIEDATAEGASASGWAGAVSAAARRHGADRVIAEVNNGGNLVTEMLKLVDPGLPVRAVHASRGKAARAEPVACLYEQGRVRHLGAFPALEDQLCGMTMGLGYHGPGRSPDRADALVWALTELMLGRRAEARVRVLV